MSSRSRRRVAHPPIMGYHRRSSVVTDACPPCPPCGEKKSSAVAKAPGDGGSVQVAKSKTISAMDPPRASEAIEPIGLSYGTTSVSGDGSASSDSKSGGTCPVPVRSYCRKWPRGRSRSKSASMSAPKSSKRRSRSRSTRQAGGSRRRKSKRAAAGAASAAEPASAAGATEVNMDPSMGKPKSRKRRKSTAGSGGGKKRKSMGGSVRRKASRSKRRSGKSSKGGSGSDGGSGGSGGVACTKAVVERCCSGAVNNAPDPDPCAYPRNPRYREDDGDGYDYYQEGDDRYQRYHHDDGYYH